MKTPLELAMKEVGVKEIPGAADNPVIIQYYADAGHPGIKSEEVSWCAAFAGAMLARAGIKPSGSLAARSYLQWGIKVESLEYAMPGDVVVLWRNSPDSWEGHVGFYLSHRDGNVQLVSGNVQNRVGVDNFVIGKVLGIRRPPKNATQAGKPTQPATAPAQKPNGTPARGFGGVLADLLNWFKSWKD